MADEDALWCLIESDPAVFWGITNELGVNNIEYDEVLALDPGFFKELANRAGDILGLIFLYRWHPALQQIVDTMGENIIVPDDDMFFAHQVIKNSCATQAMLSVLLNRPDKIQLGPILSDFKEFTNSFDPNMRGIALGNHERIRDAHNRFKQNVSLTLQNSEPSKSSQDAFHFIAIVPNIRTKSIILHDGLRNYPLKIGSYENYSDWYLVAIFAAKQIINGLQNCPGYEMAQTEEDIRFNLIAVLPDSMELIEKKLQDQRVHLKCKLESMAAQIAGKIPNIESVEEKTTEIQIIINRIEGLKLQQQAKSELHHKWREENEMRQIDLLPFYLCAVKHLAKKGKLQPAYMSTLSMLHDRTIKKSLAPI